MIHVEAVSGKKSVFWERVAKSFEDIFILADFADDLMMLLIAIFAHVDVSGIGMSCTASRLDVLNQCCVEIKSNDEVAIGDVESFLGHRCCEKTVELAFAEVHYGEYLLTEGNIHITSISASGSDLYP
jgi:hypothetical protein